jgi:hypothetical protein
MRRILSITFAMGLACTTTSEEPAPRAALALGGDGCTIDDEAELRCWGSLIWNVPLDWEGPGEGRYAVPVVDVPGGAIDVAVGDGWICALTGRGSVACWGSSSTELDFLTQDEPGEPVIADVGEPFVDVAVGWAHPGRWGVVLGRERQRSARSGALRRDRRGSTGDHRRDPASLARRRGRGGWPCLVCTHRGR